jgi:hypothetical protein
MDDDKIVEAGVAASWLFLAMLLGCKRYGTDGTLTRPQMSRLGVDKWQRSVEKLIEVGLVMDISEPNDTRKVLWIVSWSKWNLLSHEREERRQMARSAAQKRWEGHSKRNANRIASGNATADAKKRREEKRYSDDASTQPQTVDNPEAVLGEILRRSREL